MQPLEFIVPLGFLDAVEPYIAHIVLALAIVNMITRIVAHSRHVNEAEESDADENIVRWTPHVLSTVALVLASFAFLVIHPHGGTVTTLFAITVFLADFFEFEARRVEARNNLPIERPKSAIVASVFLLLYAGYQSVFFLIKPFWNMVV